MKTEATKRSEVYRDVPISAAKIIKNYLRMRRYLKEKANEKT